VKYIYKCVYINICVCVYICIYMHSAIKKDEILSFVGK
jgi:hypothetical protein